MLSFKRNFVYVYILKMASTKVRIHRIISWLLVVFFLATIITGYAQTNIWFTDQYLLSKLHRVFEWFFIALLLYHLIYTLVNVRIRFEKLFSKIRERKGTTINSLRLIQKLSSWGVVVVVFFFILSGLNGYVWFANTFGELIPFSWHRSLDLALNIFIIIHIAVGLKFFLIRKNLKHYLFNAGIILITASLMTGVIFLQVQQNKPDFTPTIYQGSVKTSIDEVDYFFNTTDVISIRPDIFTEGHFSIFDILVHLDTRGSIDMDYHFDASMNTHVIDSLNGETGWWYNVWYSGGWPERSAFRMDHYPWKEGTTLNFFKESESFLDQRYNVFRQEITRKQNNSPDLIIPTVRIFSRTFSETHYNVSVTAHNLRNDTFQLGVITAIDVIMSMGDQGLLTYQLTWYDSVGDADIVRDYWVTAINFDTASGTCGYVYESGSHNFEGFSGNHIHIPQDYRPLNSPEYYETFWICL